MANTLLRDIPDETHKQIKIAATILGVSINALLIQSAEEKLERLRSDKNFAAAEKALSRVDRG